MCTLTYIPTKTGFVFTHNRDENALREPAFPPSVSIVNGIEILFPKDGRAGGTWIACNQIWSVCLLNGAFEKHKHLPPYAKSRGIVLLDFFAFDDLKTFSTVYDFSGIEPFTLVCAENHLLSVFELRWDGERTYFKALDREPQIWSSATLYNLQAREKRMALFNQFILNHQNPTAEQVFDFHRTGKTGIKEENLVMERPSGVKTLSISQIYINSNLKFTYTDLILHAQSIQYSEIY